MTGPPPKQDNVRLACELAWKGFAGKDLRRAATCAQARLGDDGQLSLTVLGETYVADRGRQKVLRPDGGAAPDRMAALILHYLTRADGTPAAGREVGFSQIPGGSFYEGPFRKRIVSRIVRRFGGDPPLLLKCGMDLGGRVVRYGDAAMAFAAFPAVPVTIVLWRGDDEFPANANFVFDASVADYLSVEDVVVTCEELVNRLCKAASLVSGEVKT